MPFYTEPVRREPNARGRLRLVTVLGHLPGAVGRGFDGNGTPPPRGRNEEAGRRRVWWFDDALPPPWPPRVALLPGPAYDALVVVREATKPVPPPEPPLPRDLEAEVDDLTALEAEVDDLTARIKALESP